MNEKKKKIKNKKNIKKKILLNRGLEPLLSPSPALMARIVPVEPPWLDSKLKGLIARYILTALTCVSALHSRVSHIVTFLRYIEFQVDTHSSTTNSIYIIQAELI